MSKPRERWGKKKNGFPVHLSIISTQCQMTDLDINCLVLRALKGTCTNVGQTSGDKFSELKKHIPLTRVALVL